MKKAVSKRVYLSAGAVVVGALLSFAAGCGTPPRSAPVGNILPSFAELSAEELPAFSAPSPEGWSSDAPGVWHVEGERYVAWTTGDMATASLVLPNVYTNALVEVDYIRESGSVGAGGVVARASPDFKAWETGSGYLFGIGSDGEEWQAAIIRQSSGEAVSVLSWTNVSAFASHSNHLAVLLSDRLLQFYVNGVLFWEGLDRGLTSGSVGLFASTPEGFGATHEFAAFSVKSAASSVPPVIVDEKSEKAPPVAQKKEGKKSRSEKKEKAAEETSARTADVAAPAVAVAPALATASSSDSGPDRSPLLRPGFLLRVSVLVSGKREIDGEVKRVSDGNMLELPLIGQISVEGVSLRRLNEVLQTRYAEFFVNPQVTAEFVMEERADAISPWGSVVVLGRVRTPGRVNIPPTQDLRLSAAIQQAGGLDTSARASAIRLTRKKDDGTTEQKTIDFTAIGQQGEIGNDLLLQAGDLIFVPERIF